MLSPCDSPRYPPGGEPPIVPAHIVWGGLERPRAGDSRKQSLGRGRGRAPRRRNTWSDSRSESADGSSSRHGSSSRSSSNHVLSERAAITQLEALNISPGEVTFYESSSGSGNNSAGNEARKRRGIEATRSIETKRRNHVSDTQRDGATSSAAELRERIEGVLDKAKIAMWYAREGQVKAALLRLPHSTVLNEAIIPGACLWNTHHSKGDGIDLDKLAEEDENATNHPFVAAVYNASRRFERGCKEEMKQTGKKQLVSAKYNREVDMAGRELIEVLTGMQNFINSSGQAGGSGDKLETLTCHGENRENLEIHDERNAQDHLLGPSSATKFQTLCDANAALQTLGDLKASNQANVDTYHNAMAACIAANDMVNAQKIFQELDMLGQSNDDSARLMMMAGGSHDPGDSAGDGATDFQYQALGGNCAEISSGWSNTHSSTPLALPYQDNGAWTADSWSMEYGDAVPPERAHEQWRLLDNTAGQNGDEDKASEKSAASSNISFTKLVRAMLKESDSDSDPEPAKQGKNSIKATQPSASGSQQIDGEQDWGHAGSIPLDEEGNLTSIGSVNHDSGECKPCSFVGQPDGCRNGISCAFCHFKHDKVKARRKKLCKGQRDRHKKLAERLAQEILYDPWSFDFDRVELPPSVLSNERVKIKWSTRLEKFRDEVIAVRTKRSLTGNPDPSAGYVAFGDKMHRAALAL